MDHQHASLMMQYKTSPYGTISIGDGNTIEMLENPLYWQSQMRFHEEKPPDLTVHGMSIAELNNTTSGGVHVSAGNSPMRLAKLAHM